MKWLLTAVALSLLGGCSAIHIAYDNADLYLRWRAGNYLDLKGEVADDLEQRIQDLLAWHRREALPRYANIADAAARRLSRGTSRADLDWGYDSVMAQVKESLRAAAVRVAPLLDRLTPEQLAYLEQRFAEDNRTYVRENLRGTEQERRQRRVKRTVERAEDWVGALTPVQLERIRQYSERAPLLDEHRDLDRKRLQAVFVSLARARQATQQLPERAVNWQAGRSSALIAATELWRQEYFAMALELDRTLTSEQRARAVAQFHRYALDMRLLAGRAGGAARIQ